MLILPGAISSSDDCAFVSSAVLVAIVAVGTEVVDGVTDELTLDADPVLGGLVLCGVNTVNVFGFSARTFSRPALIPQPPIFSCFASSSNC